MDFITLLSAVALLLLAIGMSSRGESPWIMLAGFGLAGIAVVSRVLYGGGFFEVVVPLFTDAGISLLVAAAWLAFRKPGGGARPFFVLGLLSLAAAGLFFLAASLFGVFRQDVSLLVELGPDDSIEELGFILGHYEADASRAFPTVDLSADEDLAQVYLANVEHGRADALMADLAADTENVDYVEVNASVEVMPLIRPSGKRAEARHLLENDPRANEQWALEAIRGHEAHALLSELKPVRKARVAILDTGVESAHEDLAPVFSAGPPTRDEHGHGTHCAGIAGAATNNRLGVASLNWDGAFIEILAFHALGDNGRGTLEEIAQAIVDATQSEADIISMSLGSMALAQPRVIVASIAFAHKHGVIVAASAGNNDKDASDHFPSNIEGVFAIAAVDRNLDKAKFSNTVGSLSRPLAAPGVDILSSYPGSQYTSLSGTSMATPVVTGLLGVMRALAPDMTAATAYDILHETGAIVDDTPRIGRVINAEAAIRATLALHR